MKTAVAITIAWSVAVALFAPAVSAGQNSAATHAAPASQSAAGRYQALTTLSRQIIQLRASSSAALSESSNAQIDAQTKLIATSAELAEVLNRRGELETRLEALKRGSGAALRRLPTHEERTAAAALLQREIALREEIRIQQAVVARHDSVRLHASAQLRLTDAAFARYRALASGGTFNMNLRESNGDTPTAEFWGEVAELADAVNARFRIRWTSYPTDRATVFYQTVRERERGDRPRSLPATTNSVQEFAMGCYYIWLQRGARITSDYNREICVLGNIPEVVLVEQE
ncbi:MAG TPA: hypothetical protein VF647_09795 [Longimicrobium sp.]|jgi:hypothetical protein